jgi:hypothetical protein
VNLCPKSENYLSEEWLRGCDIHNKNVLTIIGWIPAFIWAETTLNRMYADKRTNKLIREMRS